VFDHDTTREPDLGPEPGPIRLRRARQTDDGSERPAGQARCREGVIAVERTCRRRDAGLTLAGALYATPYSWRRTTANHRMQIDSVAIP
jgi:hypothetical protein